MAMLKIAREDDVETAEMPDSAEAAATATDAAADIRIEHTVRESFTLWHGDRPIATFTGADGQKQADRLAGKIKLGEKPSSLDLLDNNLGDLPAIEFIERQAAHWDQGWSGRDHTTPLSDRLLLAGTDAGNRGDVELMFQLLSLCRDSLRHERKSRYGRRFATGRPPGISSITLEQIGTGVVLRKAGYTWSKIGEILKLPRSTVRTAVIRAMKAEAETPREVAEESSEAV